MLRRNFLKLLGLLPFGGLALKAETKPELYISKETFEEIKDWGKKYYARVASKHWFSHPYKAIYYGEFEVELEEGCKPKPNYFAWVSKDGRVTDKWPKIFEMGQLTHYTPAESIGVFVSERYTKETVPNEASNLLKRTTSTDDEIRIQAQRELAEIISEPLRMRCIS